jgi:GDP/UDP-N,N'-diacetylbacillosamine 2-epimerase (hydrolysing)
LVVGDREESIATALVGNYMNILVAHLGGGDPVYGNADDPIRMAVSKLCHIHLVTAQQYADNLVGLKEDPFRIFFVGNPAFANIENTEQKTLIELSEYMNFDISNGKYIVLVKHPLSSEEGEAYFQMKTTLLALEEFCIKNDFKVVASYPNSDPGSYDIIQAISEFENKDFIKFNHTLPREYFVNLMRNTKALVGNSSMGILEAPYYKLPVINIGNRQKGRLNAGNVVFVPYEVDVIVKQIERACFDKDYILEIQNLICPFGTAEAPQNILNALKCIEPKDNKWLIKSNLC